MSVDMSLHVFLESTALEPLRPVLAAHLAQDEDLAFVLALPDRPRGLWITVFDPTKGVNYYGLGEELSKAAACRAWEVINQEEEWILHEVDSGQSDEEGEHHSGRDDVEEALGAALGEKVVLPDTWDGDLPAARVATVGARCNWKQLAIDLGLTTPKKPKTLEPDPTLTRALEAVYQRPGDRKLRLAYAKLLTDAGDPRGEFITLDCAKKRTPAQARRHAALLSKHEHAWAAPFGEVFEWEGGFPASVSGDDGPPVGHQAWATVHSVTHGSAALLASLSRLDRATSISPAVVKALARKGKAVPLRELTIDSDDERLLELLTRVRFPKLLHVNFEEANALTAAHVEFMQSRPGVRVSVGLDAAWEQGPLSPFPIAKVEKLAADLRRAREAKEAEKLPPGKNDVTKAIATGDHFAVVKVLDRMAKSPAVLRDAALTVLHSKAALDFTAACLGPFLRALELSADQWVDLAEGGTMLDNMAIRDVSISRMGGPASPERLKALAKRARGKKPVHERLRWLHHQLTT